jgi:hypothetical protein
MHCEVCVLCIAIALFFFSSSREFLMVVLVYGPSLCIMRVLVLCVFDIDMTKLFAFCHERI